MNTAFDTRRGSDLLGFQASVRVAPQHDGSYSAEQLLRYIWDIRLEPAWRREAEIDNAYYDGDQLRQTTLQRMKELGIPPIVVNHVAPAVDSVTGWEAMARADLQLVPETEDAYEAATALNIEFKKAMRLSEFDIAVGHQFGEACKHGVGWLEVSRDPDPFHYPYRVRLVPWREIFFDYRAREPDLSDTRYILRRKWYDIDQMYQFFPRHRKLLDSASRGLNTGWFNEWEEIGYNDLAEDLAYAIHQERNFTLEDDEWRQQHRGRIPLYEILYTVPRRVMALTFPTGFVMEFDKDNLAHHRALRDEQARVTENVTDTWRQAWFIGPDKIGDRALPTNRPHYIPMVAFRKDSDGSPYGLIRRMRSPQEAINARHSRLLYDISSRKFVVDDDAVDNHALTAEELNKANSYVVVKGERRGEGINMLPTSDVSAITMELLQESKRNVFEVSGIHREFTGQAPSDRSGVAIDGLIEQTEKTLGVIVDNYKAAKKMAGQQLLAMLVADLSDRDDHSVEADGREIVLNARTAQPGIRDNEVLMIRAEVALGDAPASVTYQEQKFKALSEVVKSMPPEIAAQMMDIVIAASGVPGADEMVERLRQITGHGPEPKDPAKRQQLQQQMAQEQQMQQAIQELQIRLQAAEVQLAEARAANELAKAEKTAGADTELTEAKTVSELAKAESLGTEADRADRETDARLIEASAKLRSGMERETAEKTESKKSS